MPAVPRSAAAGTVRTFVALSMVIVTSAVIPARTVGGRVGERDGHGVRDDAAGACRAAAVGAIAVTLPVTLRADRADRDRRGLADRDRRRGRSRRRRP